MVILINRGCILFVNVTFVFHNDQFQFASVIPSFLKYEKIYVYISRLICTGLKQIQNNCLD